MKKFIFLLIFILGFGTTNLFAKDDPIVIHGDVPTATYIPGTKHLQVINGTLTIWCLAPYDVICIIILPNNNTEINIANDNGTLYNITGSYTAISNEDGSSEYIFPLPN